MRTNTSVKSKTVKPNHLTAIKDLSLKVRSPDGSNLNSARQHQKTNENENRMFQFSRCELDNKLREFSQAIFKNKSFQKSTPTSCLNDLKKSFFEILKGSDKELSMKNKRNSENINQEFSFLLREAELQRRINELEEDKITYEEKIENHTSYIADLESKVDRLIDEYENTLKVNQTLMSEIQSSKNETTVWSGSDPKDRSNSETVAEVESLRLLNSQLQNQMSYAHENICKLEDMLRQACLQDARNLKYYEEIQKVQSQLTDRSTRSHNSDLLENLAQSVQQEQRTEILTESREAELQREIADYQSQIENLTALMKKTNEELKSTKVKCSELEDEVLSFNNFDNALQEKIKLLEEQVKNLSEENVALQAIKEENSATISTLKDQIKEKIQPGSYVEDPKDQSMDSLIDLGFLCPKGYVPSLNNFVKESENTLEKSLKAKEKELEDEKMNHKLQIEKYTMSLTTLSGKVQILVSINENLTRDMEYMKQESNNYRTIIWSIYQQIKKHLDVYKVKDDELQHHFKAPAKNDSDKLDFIVYFYQQLRKEVGLIDCLLEERRNYI